MENKTKSLRLTDSSKSMDVEVFENSHFADCKMFMTPLYGFSL